MLMNLDFKPEIIHIFEAQCLPPQIFGPPSPVLPGVSTGSCIVTTQTGTLILDAATQYALPQHQLAE